SSPTRVTGPAKPAPRRASAARPPACPAPMMRMPSSVIGFDENLAALGLHLEDLDRLGDRRAHCAAGGELEASLVQRTLDAAVFNVTVREQRVLVGADVVHRV